MLRERWLVNTHIWIRVSKHVNFPPCFSFIIKMLDNFLSSLDIADENMFKESENNGGKQTTEVIRKITETLNEGLL